jgi:hypothetical protein
LDVIPLQLKEDNLFLQFCFFVSLHAISEMARRKRRNFTSLDHQKPRQNKEHSIDKEIIKSSFLSLSNGQFVVALINEQSRLHSRKPLPTGTSTK